MRWLCGRRCSLTKGCERVKRYSFELARQRSKLGAEAPVGRVTNCMKSNALRYSLVFWDTVVGEVAADFPDVETDMALDALSMWLVKNPEWFDVAVASNLFGDIITDLGAMLQGGLGLAAGGNIDPSTGSVDVRADPRRHSPSTWASGG